MDLYLMADAGIANGTGAPAAEQSRAEVLHWFDELRDPLRRYLLCAGASAADVDDAVQETFLQLHRHLENAGDRTNLLGWVFRVARNYLRDEWKSARRRRTVPLDDAMAGGADPADPRGSPEHGALDEERSRRLYKAMERLPAAQRECMLLRSSGLRYREIAKIMGITTAGVGTLVHRATVRLSEDLT